MVSRALVSVAGFGPVAMLLCLLTLGGGPPPRFGDPLPGLDPGLLARFRAGQDAFEEDEDVPGGLGPVFNEIACARCHDGVATGGGSDILETRFGRAVGDRFDPLADLGGSLIQGRGIGTFNGVDFVGEVVPPQANVTAGRRTTPLFGLGLVDAVPDADLVGLAQLERLNTPDTAGRAALVPDVASGQVRVGRFGWKCQVATLATFAGDAYLNEMGITTPMFPGENCPQGDCTLLAANPAATNPNDPDNSAIGQFADFMTFLAPPPPGASNPHTDAGAALFAAIGCADCHTPALRTGPNPVAALDGVEFFPYSDFLLHDMGDLGDGIAQADAGRREMRTAPLWGLRVLTSFLHDGRAATPEAAVLAHDGQGRPARDRFAALGAADRNRLLAFLRSL